MGKFAGYLGKLELDVDGEKLELDVRLKDKQKLLSFSQSKSNDQIDLMTEVFLEILKRSYPEEPEDELNSFLTKKLESFLKAISIAFGWASKEDMEKLERSFRETKQGTEA